MSAAARRTLRGAAKSTGATAKCAAPFVSRAHQADCRTHLMRPRGGDWQPEFAGFREFGADAARLPLRQKENERPVVYVDDLRDPARTGSPAVLVITRRHRTKRLNASRTVKGSQRFPSRVRHQPLKSTVQRSFGPRTSCRSALRSAMTRRTRGRLIRAAPSRSKMRALRTRSGFSTLVRPNAEFGSESSTSDSWTSSPKSTMLSTRLRD